MRVLSIVLRNMIVRVLLSALVLPLQARAEAARPPEHSPMVYRMATASPEIWCNPGRQEEVKNQVDKLVAAGFNTISIGSYKFMPMKFVDYSKTRYPEAQEYSSQTVAQNVKTLRENIRYAKSKGIKWVISRSYSFYAPYTFWKAHQAELNPDGIFNTLLATAHQHNIYDATLAGKDNIVPQQQWANPLFRQFFLESTSLMLDALPELDGFLNAYAEAAWTYDLKKLKENRGNRSGNWKNYVDRKATDECFVDYAESLYQLLKEKRGDGLFFGLRDWYVTPETLKRLHVPPKQLVISVKYAGFDQPLINYPPYGKSLLDAGYSVILDVHEFNAEHPHPIYWYGHDIIDKTFRNIIAAKFAGVMYDGFSSKKADASDPISLLTDASVAKAVDGKDFTDAEASNFLKRYYGNGASDVLRSLTDVSIAQEALIKLCPAWFWRGDGLTSGGPTNLQFWMLQDNPEAPPGMAFVRQDVIGVPEYAAKVIAGDAELQMALKQWKKEGKKTPYDVIELMLKSADDAVKAMLDARRKAPADAPIMRDLVASSVIHKEMVLRDVAFLRAALAYYESGGQFDHKYNKTRQLKKSSIDKKEEAVKELSSTISHDLILRKLCWEFAPRRRATRGKHTYSSQKEMAKVLGKKLEIPNLNTDELAAMTALITAKSQ